MSISGVGPGPGGNTSSIGNNEIAKFREGLKSKSEQELYEMACDLYLTENQRNAVIDELLARRNNGSGQSGGGSSGGGGNSGGETSQPGAGSGSSNDSTSVYTFGEELFALLDKTTREKLTAEEMKKLKELLKKLGFTDAGIASIEKDLSKKEDASEGESLDTI